MVDRWLRSSPQTCVEEGGLARRRTECSGVPGLDMADGIPSSCRQKLACNGQVQRWLCNLGKRPIEFKKDMGPEVKVRNRYGS